MTPPAPFGAPGRGLPFCVHGVPMRYNKPHLSFDDQLALMEKRGLLVVDREQARRDLATIGYYRLSGYTYAWRVRRPRHQEGKDVPLDEFEPGHAFHEAVALYSFDRRLRLLLLDAIERIEVVCRVCMAYEVGKRGPLAYLDPENLGVACHKRRDLNAPTNFEWFRERNMSLLESSSEVFARHVQDQYESVAPIWIAVELWDFGTLSHFYQLLVLEDQEAIAVGLGCPTPSLMQSWLRAVNHVRNICAHHSRLYRRSLVDKPSVKKLARIPELSHNAHLPGPRANKLYPTLTVILYLLKRVSPDSVWPQALKRQLESFPMISGASLHDYGFPDDWQDLELWKDIDAIPPKELVPQV